MSYEKARGLADTETEDETSPALSGTSSPGTSTTLRGQQILRRSWSQRASIYILLGVGAVLCFAGLLWMYLRPKETRLAGGPGETAEDLEAILNSSGIKPVGMRRSLDAPKFRWVQLGGGKRTPVDEGLAVETTQRVDKRNCIQTCEDIEECKYVIICGWSCYMKSKSVGPYEPTKSNSYCATWIYTDIAYIPGNPVLNKPSNAPKLTFYMYRTQGPPLPGGDYPLANVNAASIGGVLWYLQNEMIKDCAYGGTLGSRRFGATRIRRFKITMKATQPLYDKGLTFGKLCSFDSGECTGPHRHGWTGVNSGWNSKPEWDDYGFFVGCGKLGEYPHQEWPSGKRYPNAVWYGLAGPCPTMNFHKATEQCNQELPGGLCEEVTGQGNCTYHTEPAGELDIDELVGIKPRFRSREEFCRAGCAEGDPANPLLFGPDDNYDDLRNRGCTTWWANIWDPLENKDRVEQILDAFHKKYPNMPKEDDMPPPPCDFNTQKYFGWGR